MVTGGGGGIGTAVALELARRGVAVVAMDPGVGVQGEPLNEPTAAQTAERIVAEGGVARASSASVTDRAAVRSLFAGVIAEFGALDIVVNTAGILRYAPFLDASEQDWRAVLDVHLNGYLNVLSEAVPLMAAAGYGRIVGVTSGAGLARASGDAAAYACAKRAVAAVTWQLADLLPEGLALNALSPLAATRMTTRAVTRGDAAQAAGGLDLSGLPPAHDMAPLAAFLASEEAGSCRGQVIFSAGPELSVISPPRLLEAIRTDRTADFAASLDTLVPVVLAPAEAQQRSTGGSNARFGPVFDQPGTPGPVPGPAPARNCLVITDHPALATSIAAALARCGLTAIDITGRPLTGPSAPHQPAPSHPRPRPRASPRPKRPSSGPRSRSAESTRSSSRRAPSPLPARPRRRGRSSWPATRRPRTTCCPTPAGCKPWPGTPCAPRGPSGSCTWPTPPRRRSVPPPRPSRNWPAAPPWSGPD